MKDKIDLIVETHRNAKRVKKAYDNIENITKAGLMDMFRTSVEGRKGIFWDLQKIILGQRDKIEELEERLIEIEFKVAETRGEVEDSKYGLGVSYHEF